MAATASGPYLSLPQPLDLLQESEPSQWLSSAKRDKCLSSEPHFLPSLEDIQSHYFGCLPYSERSGFWGKEAKAVWADAVNLAKDAKPLVPWSNSVLVDTSSSFVKHACAQRLREELRRVKRVRAALKDDEATVHLVQNLENSRLSWKNSPEKNCHMRQRLGITTSDEQDAADALVTEYNKSRDQPHPELRAGGSLPDGSPFEIKKDAKSVAIFMEPGREPDAGRMMVPRPMPISDNSAYRGQYPDQYLSVKKLLEEEFVPQEDFTENWRSKKVKWQGNVALSDDVLRYFHISFNNMAWVEEAMQAYFAQRPATEASTAIGQSDSGKVSSSPAEKSSDILPGWKMVLREELWKGQEHGTMEDEGIVHSRFLRCLCERFSTDPTYSYEEEKQNNMVVFMPYLHWDIDRNRSRMAEAIEQATDRHESDKREDCQRTREGLKEGRKKQYQWTSLTGSAVQPPQAGSASVSADNPSASSTPQGIVNGTQTSKKSQEADASGQKQPKQHRHVACIPPVTHDDLDYYQVPYCSQPSKVPTTDQDKCESDDEEDSFCLHAAPKKIEDIFLLKMRDDCARRRAEAVQKTRSTHPSESPGWLARWNELIKPDLGRLAALGEKVKTLLHGQETSNSANLGQQTSHNPDIERNPLESVVSRSTRGEVEAQKYEKEPRKLPKSEVRQETENSILDFDILGSHRRLRPKHKLARYLVDAARLYEAMNSYRDQKVIEDYLFPKSRDVHLHPRRTLDQSYFWKLRTTRRRDRDQVVYRHTVAHFHHKLIDDKKRLNLLHELLPVKAEPDGAGPRKPEDGSRRPYRWPRSKPSNASADTTKPKAPTNTRHTRPGVCSKCAGEKGCHWKARDNWRWTGHTKHEDLFGCEQCRQDISKVARVVMVDQLWMWILDENTILTCFPKRYGVGRKDPSGVHYGIRKRLADQTNHSNQVRSVFDLALIILDQSFKTFFDRRKTPDKRPQVIDIFIDSIGNVANKQTIALNHLQETMRQLHLSISQSADGEKIPSTLLILLNIQRESALQQEIRDIIDEINMIISIVKQQKEMIERFSKLAEEILQGKEKADAQDQGPEKLKLKHFQQRKENLHSEISRRLLELEGLKQSAEDTALNVENLMNLKQQQAGVVQTYQSIKQGGTTVMQGKAVMVFTILTIVFLPMSFFTSLFGMNNVDLNPPTPSNSPPGNSSSDNVSSNNTSSPPYSPSLLGPIAGFPFTTLRSQILLMFLASFGIIVFILFAAFDNVFRRFFILLAQALGAGTRYIYHRAFKLPWRKWRLSNETDSAKTDAIGLSSLFDPSRGERRRRLEWFPLWESLRWLFRLEKWRRDIDKNTDSVEVVLQEQVKRWNEKRDKAISDDRIERMRKVESKTQGKSADITQ